MALRQLKVTILGNAKGLVDSLGEATEEADAFGEKLGKVAAGVATAIGAIAAAAGATLGAALFESMNLEVGNDKLRAQLNLTAEEAERAGKLAGDLYSNSYGDSIEDVNEAIKTVSMSMGGFGAVTDEELTNATAQAMSLAGTFDTDVTTVINGASQMVKNGFAKDMQEAMDLSTRALQGPINKTGDALEILDEYAANYTKLGLEGPEAIGKINSFLEAGGWSADLASDSMREFAIRATDGSLEAATAVADIGVNWEQLSSDINAGGDTAQSAFEGVIDQLNGVQDATLRNEAGAALFGSMWEDGGATAIMAMGSTAEAITDVAGAAADVDSIIADNALTRIEGFKRTVKTQVVDFVGDQVLPLVNRLTEEWGPKLTDLFENKVMPAFHQLSDWWAKEGPGIMATARLIAGVVGAALGAVGSAVGAMIRNWDTVGPILKAVTAIVLTVLIPGWVAAGIAATVSSVKQAAAWVVASAGATKSAVLSAGAAAKVVGHWVSMGAQALFHAAKVAAAWLIALGPVALVIAAVVGIVALIVLNFDKIKSVIGKAWEWVKDTTSKLWNGTVDLVKKAGIALFNALPMTRLVRLVADNWGQIKEKTSAVFRSIEDTVKGAFGRLVDVATFLPRKLLSALGSLKTMLGGVGRDLIGGLWEGIERLGGWITDKLTAWVKKYIPGPIKKALGINSNSRVMRDEVGVWIPGGVVEGIEDRAGDVDQAMTNLVKPPRLGAAGFGTTGTPAYGAAGTGAVEQHFHFSNIDPDPHQVAHAVAWTLKTSGE